MKEWEKKNMAYLVNFIKSNIELRQDLLDKPVKYDEKTTPFPPLTDDFLRGQMEALEVVLAKLRVLKFYKEEGDVEN